LRQQLIDQGWVELENDTTGLPPALRTRKTGVLAALSVASGARILVVATPAWLRG
jgi:hypothetical protein